MICIHAYIYVYEDGSAPISRPPNEISFLCAVIFEIRAVLASDSKAREIIYRVRVWL